MSVFSISEMTTKASMYSSTCVIELLLFASGQHVVAYRVGGLVLVNSPPQRQNGNRAPLSLSRGGGGTLEIVVKYSTTLNVRYPHPIVALRAASGRGRHPQNKYSLAPAIMHQPVLCSVSTSLDDAGDDESNGQPLAPAFFVIADYLLAHNLGQRPCYGQYKLKPS
jgi:hypothetical protein